MKTFRTAMFFVVSFAVAAMPAFAADKINIGLREVVKTVEDSYRTLENVTVDFFQRSTLAGKDKEMRADGEMFLKKTVQSDDGRDPDRFLIKFRFDYFRPTRHEIVCNGETLWIHLPESRKVIQSDVSYIFSRNNLRRGSFDPFADGASNFLQGLGRISQDFQIHFSPQMQDMDGNYILELSPRRSSVSISKLFIVVDSEAVRSFKFSGGKVVRDTRFPKRNFPVLSTTVVDQRGNMTTMEFSNHKDTSIFDGLFEFMIPAGVQVERPPRSGR